MITIYKRTYRNGQLVDIGQCLETPENALRDFIALAYRRRPFMFGNFVRHKWDKVVVEEIVAPGSSNVASVTVSYRRYDGWVWRHIYVGASEELGPVAKEAGEYPRTPKPRAGK